MGGGIYVETYGTRHLGGGIWVEASGKWHLGGIWSETSWRRHLEDAFARMYLGAGIWDKAFGKRYLGGCIWEDTSGRRQLGGGIYEEAHGTRHLEGGIWEEASGRMHLGCIWDETSGRRHLWVASARRHLRVHLRGGIWEDASGRRRLGRGVLENGLWETASREGIWEEASGRGHLGWHTDQGASISTARTLQAKACLGKVYIYIYIYKCNACPGSYTNVRKGFRGGVAVARLNQRCRQNSSCEQANKP